MNDEEMSLEEMRAYVKALVSSFDDDQLEEVKRWIEDNLGYVFKSGASKAKGPENEREPVKKSNLEGGSEQVGGLK